MRVRFILGLGLGICGHPLRLPAQVNIEALRRDTAGQRVTGNLGADLAVRTGNVELLDIGLRGRVDYPSGRLTTFLVGEGTLGLLRGRQFTSTGMAHLRQTYGLRPHLEPEWYAQVNYDKPRLIDFRALAGAGLRFRLLHRDAGRLWLGTGFMLEHERLDLSAMVDHPARTTVIRSSSYLSIRATGGNDFVLTSTTYLQPQVTEVGDLRVLENLALAVGVTRALAVVIRFDLRYDSRPPDPIKALDTALLSGITVEF